MTKLTTRKVSALTLYLAISATAGGISKRWSFLYVRDGRQREMGLVPPTV